MKERKEFLKVNFRTRSVKAGLIVYDFEDNGYQIAYIPSLNLSGYGNTKEEAREMLLDVVVDEFFENIFDLGETKGNEELKKVGWAQSSYFKKRFTSTTYVDREGVLKNFNLSEETEIKKQFVAV